MSWYGWLSTPYLTRNSARYDLVCLGAVQLSVPAVSSSAPVALNTNPPGRGVRSQIYAAKFMNSFAHLDTSNFFEERKVDIH